MSICNVNVRVTTTANRVDLLTRAVDAFTKQTYVNFNLHIIISQKPYLIDHGFEKAPAFGDERVFVHWSENTGSYRKMYPLDLIDISKPLMTIDDDVLYDIDILKKFMQAYEDSQKEMIICSMARRRIKNLFGRVANYESWPLERKKLLSLDLLPIGAGGVLYPPSYLAFPEHSSKIYLDLAPKNDDIWFNSIARKYNVPILVDPNLGKSTSYMEHSFGLHHSNLTKRVGGNKLLRKLHGATVKLKSYLKIASSPNDEAVRRLNEYFKLSKK